MGKRVLVVCQDESLGSFLEVVLQFEGYEARSARDFVQADEMIAEQQPDIALVDLPGEDPFAQGHAGLDATTAWRARHDDIPAILVAGELTSSQRAVAISAFDRVEDKHKFDLEELLRDLRELTADE